MQTDPIPLYRNAVEPLVVEEVQRQLLELPPQLAPYINPAQVIAYALNQLPPLYATSERGWKLQQQRVQKELHSQLMMAVHQGIAAVQRDPLRTASPVTNPEDPTKKKGYRAVHSFTSENARNAESNPGRAERPH